jgi:transcriptional regulator with XRE-family HTH domain
MNKQRFGEYLRARFKELGLNQKTVAKRLEVKRSTFFDSWCGETGFPRSRMQDILGLAQVNLTLEEIQQKFDIEFMGNEMLSNAKSTKNAKPKDLIGALKELDRKQKAIEAKFEEVGQDTKNLPNLMGAYDYAVSFTSTLIPLAFRHKDNAYREFAESIAQAIMNKAVFVFFTPTEKVVTNYYVKKWRLSGTESANAFAAGFKALRDACIEYLSQKSSTDCFPEGFQPKGWVDSRLGHFPVDDCPMWVPGFVFTLLGTTKRDQRPIWRALVRVPDGRLGGVFPFPEEEYFRTRLLEFCRWESKRLCECAEQELRRIKRHGPGGAGQRRMSAAKLQAKEDQVMLLRRFRALANREETFLRLVEEDTLSAV